MKKLSILSLFVVALCGLFIAGCSSSSGYGDVFHDVTQAETLQKDIAKSLDGNKIFEEMYINASGIIVYSYQDKNNLDKVDRRAYSPEGGGWQKPDPVKISLDGDSSNKEDLKKAISNVSWDINEIDFKIIPEVVKAAEAKAKEAEIEKAKVDIISLSVQKGIFIDIKGERQDATYSAKTDGSFVGWSVR